MAVTDWVAVGVGVTPGHATAISGVVVNGAGGAAAAPTPTSGRGYPRT